MAAGFALFLRRGMEEEVKIGEPKASKHPAVRRGVSLFFAGVAALVPVGGTIWLIYLIYKGLLNLGNFIIDSCIFRSLNWVRGADEAGELWRFEFPGANFVRFALPVAVIFATGFAVTNAPGRRVISWMDLAMTRIPVLGFIYAAIKQFVDALRNLGGPRKFKSVAYIDYPSPGHRLIGFVTGNYRDPDSGSNKTAVFIPTSPNPLTGFTLLVDNERVINSNISLEEASKMILSAGLVSPGSEGKQGE